MNDFEERWRVCAARARESAPREDSAPYGFAARVVALAGVGRGGADDLGWDRWLVRLLAAAVAVLLVCVAFEGRHLRDARPLDPGIENTVAQLVWRL